MRVSSYNLLVVVIVTRRTNRTGKITENTAKESPARTIEERLASDRDMVI